MADAPYLVALALVEFAGKRALPLTGRSLPAAATMEDPGEIGHTLALELLLRLWQRSEEAPLQRAAGDNSMLLVEMQMEAMLEQLPQRKASWLSGASTEEVLQEIRSLANRAWRIAIAKHEPVTFIALPESMSPGA